MRILVVNPVVGGKGSTHYHETEKLVCFEWNFFSSLNFRLSLISSTAKRQARTTTSTKILSSKAPTQVQPLNQRLISIYTILPILLRRFSSASDAFRAIRPPSPFRTFLEAQQLRSRNFSNAWQVVRAPWRPILRGLLLGCWQVCASFSSSGIPRRRED